VTTGIHHRESPPGFLGLVGHPVRWRLLSELAHSDRRVGELCALLGRRQSLVSYHLQRLRSERLVSRRRSTADGRDSYYSLDFEQCGELLSGTGVALHPGLRLQRAPARRGELPRHSAAVLFLCTGNSARSQIAEALARHLSGGAVDAVSAGSHPKSLHPNAVRVLAARGIDIAGATTKSLERFTSNHFGYVISLCDRVREVCPEFPEHPDLIHWSVPDPAKEGETDQDTYPAFQRTREELETRVGFLLELIHARRETHR
jgi:protein-tyrosine-phosphatase/DNA-binding transcriptional ArsR family regulator